MKRIWVTVKELAQEFGVSHDSVYRAYRSGKIPGSQMARTIRFDLEEVRQVMRNRAIAMPNSQCTKKRATAGGGRRRAATKRPRTVIRGLISQQSKEA
ncbi:MAG: helix-turn-helix domain-containing protein [Nitrospirota bacterium]|nr:helix-turn-helix domain-containing protein [Nitrospirota bacterium]MDE3051081.1 helix-turn-helix domain-containing protein [Nitrospirota bacterium]MDE3220137.1 helix-turn-helix domain-containing protein [Nitrospirota bacterium]